MEILSPTFVKGLTENLFSDLVKVLLQHREENIWSDFSKEEQI